MHTTNNHDECMPPFIYVYMSVLLHAHDERMAGLQNHQGIGGLQPWTSLV